MGSLSVGASCYRNQQMEPAGGLIGVAVADGLGCHWKKENAAADCRREKCSEVVDAHHAHHPRASSSACLVQTTYLPKKRRTTPLVMVVAARIAHSWVDSY